MRLYRFLAAPLALLTIVGGAVGIPGQAHAAGWTASEDDALLLDVRVGQYRLGNGVRGYQTDSGICVDLADTIMALDLPVRVDRKSRRATGWLFEETRTFTLDREANRVQIVNKVADLAPGDVHDTPEGWCVDTQKLAAWLDVTLKPDLSNALLLVSADRKLPFELAEERKARAARLRPPTSFDLRTLPRANDPYRMWRTPSVDANVSLAAVRDVQTRRDHVDVSYELFASGEIARASVDARLASDRRGVPRSLRLRASRTDPDAGLLGPMRATQAAIGDVATPSTPLVVQSTVGRGAFLSNRPVDRPDTFDRTSFRGELPAGWDAELLRNGELIGYSADRGDGRYEFIDVPLLYGQNIFELVLHGPQGQERRERRVLAVGLDSIPPRQTYYWAAVLDSGRDLIDLSHDPRPYRAGWRGGVGVERGLDARTSLSATLFTLQLDGRRRNFAEVAARRAVGPALIELSGSADGRGGLAWRGQALAQLGQTHFTTETKFGSGGFQSDRLDRGIDGLHSLSLDQAFRLGERSVPIHGELRYLTRQDGSAQLDAALRATLGLRTIALTGELAWLRQQSGFDRSGADHVEAGLRASGRIGRVRLRGETRVRIGPQPGFEESSLVAEWRAGERADWRAELGYQSDPGRGRASLGYIRRFERFALSASGEVASDGSVAGALNLAFSLGPDPRGRGLRLSANRLASEGQAFATVFRDRNADGIRQPDEPVEAGVDLSSGLGRATTTDERGRAIIDGLEPFRPILIGVDAASLPDPFVQPASGGVVVVPRPGVATRIELPLVAAGSVEGSLQTEGGNPLGGMGIELVDAEGRTLRQTRSEYDGYFLFESVPYGRYTLRLGAATASAVHLDARLAAIAHIDAASPSASVGVVVARPAPRIAATDAAGG